MKRSALLSVLQLSQITCQSNIATTLSQCSCLILIRSEDCVAGVCSVVCTSISWRPPHLYSRSENDFNICLSLCHAACILLKFHWHDGANCHTPVLTQEGPLQWAHQQKYSCCTKGCQMWPAGGAQAQTQTHALMHTHRKTHKMINHPFDSEALQHQSGWTSNPGTSPHLSLTHSTNMPGTEWGVGWVGEYTVRLCGLLSIRHLSWWVNREKRQGVESNVFS